MTTQRKKILIVGSGAREHALYSKLMQSPQNPLVICMPGNGGTPLAYRRMVDINEQAAFDIAVDMEQPDLVVFGPEVPLVAGYADRLRAKGVPVFGPNADAAIIEGSKAFMKRFCTRHGIPTASYAIVNDRDTAFSAMEAFTEPPVIKADGLCGGKGVVVSESRAHACSVIDDMLAGAAPYGEAGKTIVIEERLPGRECSIMALVDESCLTLLPPSRDYKRAHDGDKGPNTGGMGAYAPLPDISHELLKRIKDEVIFPAAAGMKQDQRGYTGVLYAGLMVNETDEGTTINVLEFNCRFGDPETQVVLPLIDSDLLPYLEACAGLGSLADLGPLVNSELFAVGVTLASKGYPGTFETGMPINDDGDGVPCTEVFHAGTKPGKMGSIVSSGGRVMTVVGLGSSVKRARAKAYTRADLIKFNNMARREDIALLS